MTTIERLTEIRVLYDNRRASRSGKDRLWKVIGELLTMIEWHGAHKPFAFPGDGVPLGTEIPLVPEAFHFERAPASQPATQVRPPKPPTYTQAQWRALGEEGRAKHWQLVREYEESLTPEEKAAILAADGEQERQRQEAFGAYKEQFDPDRPYVKPGT